MAPKRKNNNNKKRRQKANINTPNLTPDASPSKVITPHSPSTTSTPEDHSISSPIKSSHQDHSSDVKINSKPLIKPSHQDHSSDVKINSKPLIKQTQNESAQPILPESVHKNRIGPIPLSQRSITPPGSNQNHHQASDESSLPIKSPRKPQTGKQAPAVHHVKDNKNGEPTENSANSKTCDLLNKPNSNHHSADRSSQRSTDRVLKEIPNGSYKQPRSHHDQSNLTPVKSSEDLNKSPNHPSNSFKKPTKHVKFTKNLKNDQSPNTKNQENDTNEQSHSIEFSREADKKTISKNMQNSIRRELSGAADQFDFDAQQRQHAGPGGGMVKKPRHDQNYSPQSLGSNSKAGEPDPISSYSSSSETRDEPSYPNKLNKGFQHAQRCQVALTHTKHVDQPNEVAPDLLQIYLSYFDQNQDGLLDPLDTWRAFRRLRCGLIIATLATITLHAMMIPFIGLSQSGIMLDNLGIYYLPIGRYLFELIRNLVDIITVTLSRSFCLDRKDHHYPDKISPSTLWKETQNHVRPHHLNDPIGWLRLIFGWIIAVAVTRPSDLTVKYDLINGVYNGEILFLVAQD